MNFIKFPKNKISYINFNSKIMTKFKLFNFRRNLTNIMRKLSILLNDEDTNKLLTF